MGTHPCALRGAVRGASGSGHLCGPSAAVAGARKKSDHRSRARIKEGCTPPVGLPTSLSTRLQTKSYGRKNYRSVDPVVPKKAVVTESGSEDTLTAPITAGLSRCVEIGAGPTGKSCANPVLPPFSRVRNALESPRQRQPPTPIVGLSTSETDTQTAVGSTCRSGKNRGPPNHFRWGM